MVRFSSEESLFNCSIATLTLIHYPVQGWEDKKKGTLKLVSTKVSLT